MYVTIASRPVQPVNHCFTTCTGRTSRVKPFTGRICSTVLDKDAFPMVLEDFRFSEVSTVLLKTELSSRSHDY